MKSLSLFASVLTAVVVGVVPMPLPTTLSSGERRAALVLQIASPSRTNAEATTIIAAPLVPSFGQNNIFGIGLDHIMSVVLRVTKPAAKAPRLLGRHDKRRKKGKKNGKMNGMLSCKTNRRYKCKKRNKNKKQIRNNNDNGGRFRQYSRVSEVTKENHLWFNLASLHRSTFARV